MKKQEFLNMVLVEADHLRKHATDEEKGRLDFDSLDIDDVTRCIYGQMTGRCNNRRANELYAKTFNSLSMETGNSNKGTVLFSVVMKSQINTEASLIFSPIEVYITMKGAKNESLISYIKGETNDWKP